MRSLQHRFFNFILETCSPAACSRLPASCPLFFLDVARYACKKTTANLLGQSTTISSGSNDLFGYKREGCRSLLTTCSPLIWWTCGESNSGPHKETIRILHAYFSLGFSSIGKTWTTNQCLILWFSSVHWGIHRLFPIYLHRWTLRFGTTSLERCLVASPCDAIKPVTYYASIRQRERNYFRQLLLWPLRFRR